MLVCNGTDLVNQVVERGHELRVSADAGEVGDFAACGGDAGFGCGLLVMLRQSRRSFGGKSSKRWVILTAQEGSSVRAPRSKRFPRSVKVLALANGAARRARAAMDFFILFFSSSLILCRGFLNVKKSKVFQWKI